MDKVRESELLSAYLDGELTAAERAHVDQLLAADPAARQWVEEFRALGKTLQSLPREKLGEDLGPRVLELAQRRMLAETPREPPQKQPAEPPRPAWRNTVRGMLSRRALAWSGLAVAIAVAMMIWNRPPENRRMIAIAPPSAAPESPAPKPAERNGPLTIQAPAELRRAPPAEGRLPPAARAKAAATAHVAPSRAESPPAPGAANFANAIDAAKEGGRGGVSPSSPADRKAGSFRLSGMKQEKIAAPQKPGAGAGQALGDGQLESHRQQARQQDKTQKDVSEIDQQEAGSKQQTSQSLLDRANVQVPSDASVSQFGARSRQTEAAAEKQRAAGKANSQALSYGGEAPTQGMLVVYCEVNPPEAANRRAFNSLLSRIGMRPTSAEEGVSRRSAKGGIHKPEQVYVDATIPQIEALLDQLAANRDAFPAVSVQPARGVDWQTDIVQHKSVLKGAAAAPKAPGQSLAGSAAANEPQPAAETKATTAKATMAPSAPPSSTPKPAPAKRGGRRDSADAEELIAGGPAHVHRVLFVFRGVDDASPNRGGR